MEKIKKISFNDGQFDVWREDSSGHRHPVYKHLGYQKRTVGSKRMFEAMQVGHTVSRVVRIPITDFRPDGLLVRENGHTYQILQAQEIYDTMPNCTQLTLENINMIWDDPRAEE